MKNIIINQLKTIFAVALCLSVFGSASPAQSDKDARPTATSSLSGVRLPAGALRVNDESVPAEITDTLGKLVALGEGKLRQGASEVLIWTGGNYRKSNHAQLVKNFAENLQSGGWTYDVGEQNREFTVFNSLKTGEQRGVIDFWTASDQALLLAWTEMRPMNAPDTVSSNSKQATANNSRSPTTNNTENILRVGKDDGYVNVMGNEMPAMPQFPALKAKPGFVRGFVKDWAGKPLQNATIGVRASYFAGQYSGAQGKTDAKGFYEFSVPKGSAHFYNAGYVMEWGDGLAATGLHPADGQLDSFVTMDGAVENFVLLPYGVTSRAKVQENPRLPASYYGGSIYIFYGAFEASDNRPYAGYVPENSVIEITLTSDAGQKFVIHKTAGFQSLFRINNIPLGRYQISAKVNGKSLNLKETGVFDQMFGLAPRETSGAANVLFAPEGAKSEMVAPQSGGWKPISINIALQ